MNQALQVFQQNIHQFINTNIAIETLSDDCSFTEGPAWNPKGYYIFSDIDANCIYRLIPGEKKEVFVDHSGTKQPTAGVRADHAGSNALAYDAQEQLLVCQHGDGAIAGWDDKALQPLIPDYNGHRFNSPNDMVVAKDGSLFFSDPPYGLLDTKLNPALAQPIAGVYRWQQGKVTLVCDKYSYPNGVCLSPDGTELLICSNKPHERFVSVYDAQTLAYKRMLAEENGDGMKCDPQGHVYLCAKEGIVILDATGERIAVLTLPKVPSNLCWGGDGLKDLFITARENVFLIRGFLR